MHPCIRITKRKGFNVGLSTPLTEPAPTVLSAGIYGVGHEDYEVVTGKIKWSGGQMSGEQGLDEPSPCIMAEGIGGVAKHQYEITRSSPGGRARAEGKLPYAVPMMDDIELAPWNGLTVVSTFSGGGGSCLGYRMAGYRVAWANEFTEMSARIYKANHPGSILDTRDIRDVEPREILAAIGMSEGEVDVLDGSPPCDSFSTAGKREKKWGKTKAYSGGKAQRTDDLFFEYIRILRGLMPRAFVAENVYGMVIGKAKGYFKIVLKALRESGYRVEARVLDAQWLGVPQKRRRVIFVGVREDFGLEPVHPSPMPYRYSVAEACPWLIGVEVKKSGKPDHWGGADEPSGSICAEDHNRPESAYFSCGGLLKSGPPGGAVEKRKFTIPEVKRLCAFPDDFEMPGSYAEQWRALGMSVPPLMMRAVARELRDKVFYPIDKEYRHDEAEEAGAAGAGARTGEEQEGF